MKTFVLAALLTVGFVLALSSVGVSQEGPAKKEAEAKGRSSNQLLMRDKLVQMNGILEGLTLNDFAEVEEAAKTLRMSCCPSAVSGPTASIRFAVGPRKPTPTRNEPMNATSAKSTQSRPHDQLPSIMSPTPARTTSSDAGVKRRSPIRPSIFPPSPP